MVHEEIYDGCPLPLLACDAAFAGFQITRLEGSGNHFLDFLAMKLLMAAMPPLPLSF
jgi:hypothetical protein